MFWSSICHAIGCADASSNSSEKGDSKDTHARLDAMRTVAAEREPLLITTS